LNLQNKRLVLAVDDLDELPDEAKAAIAKLKERVNGDGSISIEVELHDKLVALDRLGKSIGFLVAEANADAAEAAKRIIADSESTNAVERALLLSIRDIAQGQLISILRRGTPSVAGPETDIAERALQALQLMIFNGIKSLAAQLRRRANVEFDETAALFIPWRGVPKNLARRT
jgi:hypothetical protein